MVLYMHSGSYYALNDIFSQGNYMPLWHIYDNENMISTLIVEWQVDSSKS